MKFRWITCLLCGWALGAFAAGANADTIQLINGDTLNGKVLSLSDKDLKLSSEVLGEISLQRDKVVAITFGDRKPVSVDTARPSSAPPEHQNPLSGPEYQGATGGLSREELKAFGVGTEQLNKALPKLGIDPGLGTRKKRGETPEDIVQKLRTEGIDSRMMKDLEKQIPLLGVPGVKGYFNERLQGLMSGKMDLSDLRKDAIKARNGLRDLQKDLGPNGAALNGYLQILDGFIDETEPDPAEDSNTPAKRIQPSESRGKT